MSASVRQEIGKRRRPRLRAGRLRHLYLRLLGLFYLYGAAVHAANLLGFGPEAPFGLERFYGVLDTIYLVLDVAAAAGLLALQPWGVALFLSTAVTQVAIYTGFLDLFAADPGQRSTLLGLVVFHLLTMALLGALALWARRDARQVSEETSTSALSLLTRRSQKVR